MVGPGASFLVSLLIRALIPLWGFQPHGLVISQMPHFLIPSHRGLGCQHINWGGETNSEESQHPFRDNEIRCRWFNYLREYKLHIYSIHKHQTRAGLFRLIAQFRSSFCFCSDAFVLPESESESEVAQSCPTLCDPMDCSPPGSSLHGILLLLARVLEWVAISFSRGSSQPRDQTRVSCIPGRCFNLWASSITKATHNFP